MKINPVQHAYVSRLTRNRSLTNIGFCCLARQKSSSLGFGETLIRYCLALVFFPSGNGQRLLALAAFVLVLADVLLTVRRMVPLNLQLGSYDALSPAPQGQDVRQRWYALHLLRTALGVGAFTLLVLIRPT